MLILSRREAQCVCLGDDVVLTIVSVGTDKVRIGVRAPSGIRILRRELEVAEEPQLFTGNSEEVVQSPLLMMPESQQNKLVSVAEAAESSPLILPHTSRILSAPGPLSQHLRNASQRRAA